MEVAIPPEKVTAPQINLGIRSTLSAEFALEFFEGRESEAVSFVGRGVICIPWISYFLGCITTPLTQ